MPFQSVHFFLENKSLFDDVEGAGGPGCLDRDKAQYSNLLGLQSGKQEQEEEDRTVVLSVLLLSLLEYNHWLEEHWAEGWTEEKAVIAEILHRLLLICQHNSQVLSSTCHSTINFSKID